MALNGYISQTATVGKITDSSLLKPAGSGQTQISVSVPPAIYQGSSDSGTAPFCVVTSNTVLTLTLAAVPGFTTGSKAGVSWTDTSFVAHYLLDCTITSITGAVVVITAPASIPAAIPGNGTPMQANFASITNGTTVITIAIATLATSDVPNNPDLTDYSIPTGTVEELLVTCSGLGATELFAVPQGLLSGSGGAWTTSGNTLTVSGAGWAVNALAGLSFTIGGNPYTCLSNTATVATMTGSGSTSTGSETWSIASPNVVFAWNYIMQGDYYVYPNLVCATNSQLFYGTIEKIRFYNFSTTANTMQIGVQLA